MKKLIALLMSFQFIVAPLTMSQARAETTQEELIRAEATHEAQLALESTNEMGGTTGAGGTGGTAGLGGSTGGLTGVDDTKYRQGGKDAGKAPDFYVKQILAIATSCIGANILAMCGAGSTQPSMYLFFAGSLAHILGEFVGAKELNDLHKRSAKNLKLLSEEMKSAAGDGTLQKETIKAMKENEEKMRDFIKDRQSWMIAVSVFYWSAVAAALVEFWLSFPYPAGINWNDKAGCSPNTGLALTLSMGLVAAYTAAQASSQDNLATGLISGGVGLISGVLPAMVTSFGSGMATVYNVSIARAITFGVHAGLATWIAVALGDKLAVVEKNIKDLEALLASDAMRQDGATGDIALAESGSTAGGFAAGADNYKGDFGESSGMISRICASSSNGVVSVGSNCKSPLRVKAPSIHSKFDIPLLKDFLNKGSDFIDGAASNAEAATAETGSIGSQAGRMKALAEKLQKDVNGTLKKLGKSPVDFDGERKKKLAEMIQSYNQAAAAKGSPLASVDAAIIDTKLDPSSTNAPTGALSDKAGAATSGTSPISIADDPLSDVTTASSPTSSLSDSLGQFESHESDINKQSDISIFALISNRYVLNYERVMKRKDPLPEGKVATPKPK